jgi:hypothetical protein
MSAPNQTRTHPIYNIKDFRDASPKQHNNPEHFSSQEHDFQNLKPSRRLSTAKQDQLIQLKGNIGSESEIK